jgi:hypothetical protein
MQQQRNVMAIWRLASQYPAGSWRRKRLAIMKSIQLINVLMKSNHGVTMAYRNVNNQWHNVAKCGVKMKLAIMAKMAASGNAESQPMAAISSGMAKAVASWPHLA